MRAPRVYLAALLAALLTGAALRTIHLGQPALCCDEFYDTFAARSWLDGHGFAVPGREYTRARLMVLATAASFRVFGEHEWSARLPALLFGTLTLLAMWWAARTLFGRTAVVVAVALLALSPDAIDVSRFARLYAPLTLFALVAAIASFMAIERARMWPAWGAAALAAELLAVHFHPAALALGPAVCVYVALMAVARAAARDWPRAAWYAAIGSAILAAGAAAAMLPAVRATFVRAALEPLPWSLAAPADAWVHHEHLRTEYGWLWFGVWIATIVAIARTGRAGVFVACAFWVPFVLISTVVATKHHRYTLFLLPFAWLLVGAGIQEMVSLVCGAPARRRWRVAVVAAAVVAAALVVALGGPRAFPSFAAAVHRPWRTTGPFATGFYHDWRGVAADLCPILPTDARIVSDMWHAPIYYLRHPSTRLYPASRNAGAGDWETPRRRADLVVQHTPELVNAAMHAPVWLVVSDGRWRRPGYYDPALVSDVERQCRRVALSAASTLLAFDCASITKSVSAHARTVPAPAP